MSGSSKSGSSRRAWLAGTFAAVLGLSGVLGGCGPSAEPATERTVVGTWELDTRAMTEDALKQVELRLRDQARARNTPAPAAQGEGAAATPAAEAAGPSPQEITEAKEKERLRLAGTFATIQIQPGGTFLAEYRTKIENRQTRRVVRGEWVLAAGVLVLSEKEVMLNTEGTTTLESRRYEAQRSRLSAITIRGTPPDGVQELLRRQ